MFLAELWRGGSSKKHLSQPQMKVKVAAARMKGEVKVRVKTAVQGARMGKGHQNDGEDALWAGGSWLFLLQPGFAQVVEN